MVRLISTSHKHSFYRVYSDDQFLGGVSVRFLLSLGLHIPPNEREIILDDFTDSRLLVAITDRVSQTAREKLLDYLSKAEHTVYDCKKLLKRHHIPDSIVSEVISEAIEQNWLSDERYTRLYAQNATLNLMSPLDVKYKLMQKKIDKSLVKDVVNETFDTENIKDILQTLIDKMIENNRDLPPKKLYTKIATYLHRKGFEYSQYEDLLRLAISN